MSERALEGGSELRALVFLVIIGTVVTAGGAAWPLATLLRLRLPARDRVAILGAQGLGLALGRVLRDAGQTVVFVDADPQRCRGAEEDGFQVVFGDGLQERTLQRIPIELVGTAIGVTFNDNLNSQFARLTRQTFGVPHTYVSVDRLVADRPPEHVARNAADVLFGQAHDQERWDVRWRQGQVAVTLAEWSAPSAVHGAVRRMRALRKADRVSAVVMALVRNGRTLADAAGARRSPSDTAVVAIDAPGRNSPRNCWVGQTAGCFRRGRRRSTGDVDDALIGAERPTSGRAATNGRTEHDARLITTRQRCRARPGQPVRPRVSSGDRFRPKGFGSIEESPNAAAFGQAEDFHNNVHFSKRSPHVLAAAASTSP